MHLLQGPSYVISGDVIPRLLMASTVIPVIPMTQVYFTGLAPLMAHLMRIGVAGFFAYYPPQLGTYISNCFITLLKLQTFLCEINFVNSRIAKTAVFAILGAVNFVDLVNISLQKVQESIKIKIQRL